MQQLELDFRRKYECHICDGDGWVWGDEYGDYETDQRYSCRECNGAGYLIYDEDGELIPNDDN